MIEIEQHLDAQQQPTPERYRKPIVATINMPRSSIAIVFLVRLGAREGAGPGQFVYTDQGRGSGTARLVGFDPEEIRVIDDYFRVEAQRIRLGQSERARLPLELHTYGTRPGTMRNPVPMIVFGLVILGLAITLGVMTSVGPMRAPGDDVTWAYIPLFVILACGGLTIIVQHARRLSSWFALRASFRETGQTLPVGLRLRD